MQVTVANREIEPYMPDRRPAGSDAAALQTLAPGMMAGMGVPAFPPAAPAPGPVGAAAAEPGADAGDGKVEVAFRMIAPNARTGEFMSG